MSLIPRKVRLVVVVSQNTPICSLRHCLKLCAHLSLSHAARAPCSERRQFLSQLSSAASKRFAIDKHHVQPRLPNKTVRTADAGVHTHKWFPEEDQKRERLRTTKGGLIVTLRSFQARIDKIRSILTAALVVHRREKQGAASHHKDDGSDVDRKSVLMKILTSSHERSSMSKIHRILARHIVLLCPTGPQQPFCDDETLSYVYNDPTIGYMESRGILIEDVETWAWILTSQSTDQAVSRLMECAPRPQENNTREIPLTVLLHVLQSGPMSPRSLHRLLMYARDFYDRRFRSVPDVVVSTAQYRVSRHEAMVDEESSMLLIGHFIRHARNVLPEAFEAIAKLASFVFRGAMASTVGQRGSLHPSSARRLCLCFNRTLALLAVPSTKNPYQHVSYQQRAQFLILGRMTEFRPHVGTTREGFRGILRTQLAHRKTEGEREWAEYKAVTWPPWKKDKTGLDVDRSFPGSFSRGRQVLERLVQAGYELGDWENTGQVLSGWDSDGSPTIQTRTFLPEPPKNETPLRFASGLTAARIRATRTLKEAWSCFLEYERMVKSRTHGIGPMVAPHEAMLMRLLASKASTESTALPGDGLELYPEPASSHNFLYVSEDPPTFNGLMKRMTLSGLKPSEAMIKQLIDHTTNFHHTMDIWISRPHLIRYLPLLIRLEHFDPSTFSREMKRVPFGVLTSYIGLLSRIRASGSIFRKMRFQIGVNIDKPQITAEHDNKLVERCGYSYSRIYSLPPAEYARCILKLGNVRYHPAWTTLLDSMLRKICRRSHKDGKVLVDYQVWSFTCRLLHDIAEVVGGPDFQMFIVLCNGFYKILPCCTETGLPDNVHINEISRNFVKTFFSRLITGSTTFSSLLTVRSDAEPSTIFPVPLPFSLLALTRVLGLTGDTPSMLTLLHFMSANARQIDQLARETTKGRIHLRETIVMMRVFLEKIWQDDDYIDGFSTSLKQESSMLDDPLVHEARTIIEGVEEWDGWPTDEEARWCCQMKRNSTNEWRQRLQEKEVWDRLQSTNLVTE